MHRRGFTLLEVLLALAIFAMATIVLVAGYVNVLNAYALADRSTAHEDDIRFARAQLLAEPDHDKAEQGNDFDSNGAHVSWHAAIEPTDMPDLFQVTFTCEISDPGAKTEPPPVKETFMLLRPTWSDATDVTKLRDDVKQRIQELQTKLLNKTS